ncbi:MAG: hypothetical protein AAGA30_16810, partial [Planctomycetota bacterium]
TGASRQCLWHKLEPRVSHMTLDVLLYIAEKDGRPEAAINIYYHLECWFLPNFHLIRKKILRDFVKLTSFNLNTSIVNRKALAQVARNLE